MEQKKTLFMMKTASGNVKQSINKYIEICQTDTVSGIVRILPLTLHLNLILDAWLSEICFYSVSRKILI